MQDRSISKGGGFALAIGSVVTGGAIWAERVVGPTIEGSTVLVTSDAKPVALVLFVGFLLLLLGLMAFFLWLRPEAGSFGLAAFLLLFFGLSFGEIPHTVLDFAVIPGLFETLPRSQALGIVNDAYDITGVLGSVGMLMTVLGLIFTTVACLKSKRFSKPVAWSGVLAIPGAILLGVLYGLFPAIPLPHAPVAIYLVTAIWGVALIRGAHQAAALGSERE